MGIFSALDCSVRLSNLSAAGRRSKGTLANNTQPGLCCYHANSVVHVPVDLTLFFKYSIKHASFASFSSYIFHWCIALIYMSWSIASTFFEGEIFQKLLEMLTHGSCKAVLAGNVNLKST